MHCLKCLIIPLTVFVVSCGGAPGGSGMGNCDDVNANGPSITGFDIDVLQVEDTLWLSLSVQSKQESATYKSSYFPRFSLFADAQALSCRVPPFEQQISDIKISSTADYDGSHSAGESLNDLLSYGGNSLEQILKDTAWFSSSHDFTFSSLPSEAGEHQFLLEVTLDNGEEYSALSNLLNVSAAP
ncbi:hypothetical protein SAMN02745866_02691 [Alteromonadaceae bacterium Bs31]|nr:hypothetical protein SAMN02745866_02691 [Alteromonadaceae bacterium Bs31]